MIKSFFKDRMYRLGQRPSEVIFRPDGRKKMVRDRLPFTRRHFLAWRSYHNSKSLKYERRIIDKRPIYWALALGLLALAGPFLSLQMLNVVLVFCLFAAINVLWTLIIGTAGIFTLATMAVVGIAGYGAAAANVYFGVPWVLMFPLGAFIGLVFGMLLALPSSRLDGLYFALLTLGVAEICRNFVSQLNALTKTNGAITKVGSFIPQDWYLLRSGTLLAFYAAFVMLLLALLVFRLVNSEKLGLALQTAREDEEYAVAVGIDYRRARMVVFIVSSVGLGVIGALYAMVYRSISPSVFSLEQLMLMFAMLVIGGIGRSDGAVVGTAIVVFLDKALIELGPTRIIIIGLIMLLMTLFSKNGVVGIKSQFTQFRLRKMSEARARRTEKGDEYVPEEAIGIVDKDLVYARRFDKRQRDELKELITPEILSEHRAGQEPVSEDLSRLLCFFERDTINDKYALMRLDEGYDSYRIIAFSGVRGAVPRIVDNTIYPSFEDAKHAIFLLRLDDLSNS